MSDLGTQARKIILDLKPEALVCNQRTWDGFVQANSPRQTGEKYIDGVPVHVVDNCNPDGFLGAWNVRGEGDLLRFDAKVAGLTT